MRAARLRHLRLVAIFIKPDFAEIGLFPFALVQDLELFETLVPVEVGGHFDGGGIWVVDILTVEIVGSHGNVIVHIGDQLSGRFAPQGSFGGEGTVEIQLIERKKLVQGSRIAFVGPVDKFFREYKSVITLVQLGETITR